MIYKTPAIINYACNHFEYIILCHPSSMYPHLDMSAVKSLGELLKLLTHSEGDGVVSEGADSFDNELVPLLLNHLPHPQLHSNLSHHSAYTWNGGGSVFLECTDSETGGQTQPQVTNTQSHAYHK